MPSHTPALDWSHARLNEAAAALAMRSQLKFDRRVGQTDLIGIREQRYCILLKIEQGFDKRYIEFVGFVSEDSLLLCYLIKAFASMRSQEKNFNEKI